MPKSDEHTYIYIYIVREAIFAKQRGIGLGIALQAFACFGTSKRIPKEHPISWGSTSDTPNTKGYLWQLPSEPRKFTIVSGEIIQRQGV